MLYTITPQRPSDRAIHITVDVDCESNELLLVSLPAWRPGRYEMANFAKNVRNWQIRNESNEPVPNRKTSRDTWEVVPGNNARIRISYDYYAAELNAGSTWNDSSQLFINPVNCLPYIHGRLDQPSLVKLNIPRHFDIATGLEKVGMNTLHAPDYHTLADSPILAGENLLHHHFVYEGIEFHLWFRGTVSPDWSKLLNDFFLFTHEQYMLFGDFPVNKYHYLFQMVPYRLHHGVEHRNSTVIALGPGHEMMNGEGYNELLSICSHELFHTWNVKSFRPADMLPYDYNRENYSVLGFVYEGCTTYYGDLILYRSGIFSSAEYLAIFSKILQRHFDNPGRLNMAVSEASFDTWLDGYVPGMPNRKTNIYNEGALVSFITDILIRKHSEGKYSLDDVMKELYIRYGKQEKGYTPEDYRMLVNELAGTELNVFEDIIFGRNDYTPVLATCLEYIGLKIAYDSSPKPSESLIGVRLANNGGKISVLSVHPGGAGDLAGLSPGDEVIAVNGIRLLNDPESWIKDGSPLTLTCFRDHRLHEFVINPTPQGAYKIMRIEADKNALKEQKAAFKRWSGNAFPY